MKEMVGGCCVCSDERGWPDNPLVYCDGASCTVAVHQACYGIVTVPTGPWFCRKCESPDRQARVRCELCPSRTGALKRSDSGGWAHVVCALYIPEVRFGNVTSMEPIILQLIPAERFNRTCYICHEMGKVNRANAGACMQCNKTGCKQQFHVTCAQSLGLLCEEAGNYLDNVKYCGYCRHHYGKLKKGGNVKTIPPYKPVSQDSPSSDSSPENLDTPAGAAGPSAPEAAVATLSPQATTSKGSAKASTPGRKASTQGSSGEVARASSANARLVTAKSQSASSSETPSTSAAYSKPSPHGSKAIPHSTPSTSRASGSETPSTSSAAYSKQSPHAGKAIQPKPSTSQGKSEKATRKKSPSPADSLRKGSGFGSSGPSPVPGSGTSGPSPSHGSGPGTGPNSSRAPGGDGVPVTITTPAVSPHTTPKGTSPAVPVNKLHQDPVVIINELPLSTTTTGTTIITTALLEQIGAMKFTNSNFTETVVTQSDSVFGLGPDAAKQTKKRKAVSAAAAAASTSSYTAPIPSTRPQKPSSTGVITASRDARASVVERGQEPARDNRPKKMKMDLTPPPPPPRKVSTSGTLNIQMEPNLSSLQSSQAHSAHYSSTASSLAQAPEEIAYSLSSSSSSIDMMPIHPQSSSSSNLEMMPVHPQSSSTSSLEMMLIHPQSSSSSNLEMMPIHPQSSSSSGLEMIPIHPKTSNTHVQNMSQKYPNIGQERADEPPASIVVSVPLPQGPVIQLAGHQNPVPDVMFIPPQSPGPSTSNWTPKHTMNMQAEDLTIEEVMSPTRMRMETPDSMRAHQSGMSMERPNMSPDEPRSRKRGPPTAPPGGGSINTMVPHKKKKDPPPRSDTRPESQEQYYSPPGSPDARTARNIRSAIEKMARAPHMLGNELNPESAAAAHLSEHLNAELAAHSVFRAPTPLVPPPLINRATSSRNLAAPQGGPGPSGLSGLGALGAQGVLGGPSSSSSAQAPAEAVGAAPLGLAGNPQSLDQLLERQWEQGSQFLMEQAQHFDIASLLSCLHQLRTENVRLQDYIGNLSQRRDNLLAVNARLAIPLNVETPANSTFASSSRSVTPANVEVAVPMDMPRGQRDNNGNPMRPNPIRGDPNRAGPVEHPNRAGPMEHPNRAGPVEHPNRAGPVEHQHMGNRDLQP